MDASTNCHAGGLYRVPVYHCESLILIVDNIAEPHDIPEQPIYLLLAVMILLFATIGLSKLVVESKQSLLEKDESTAGKLSTLLREMQHGIENVLVETVDDPAVGEATPTPAMLSTASSSDTFQQSRSSSPTLATNPSPPAATAPGLQPELLLVQLAIVASAPPQAAQLEEIRSVLP